MLETTDDRKSGKGAATFSLSVSSSDSEVSNPSMRRGSTDAEDPAGDTSPEVAFLALRNPAEATWLAMPEEGRGAQPSPRER